MMLFRSEEDTEVWSRATGNDRGESVPLLTVWELGKLWYHDRLDPAYRGLTPDRVRLTFEQVGLVSEFWRVS
ncbi:hypothetical protein BH23CHL2_BH23CHL2_32510 [soil metagenome]